MVPIEVNHPDRQRDLKQSNAHPKQTVPDWEHAWKGAHHLEDRDRNVQDGRSKGDEQEPEQPPPMLHHTHHADGNHEQDAHQGVITFFRTFFPAKTCRGRKKPESFPLSQIVAFSSHERRFD